MANEVLQWAVLVAISVLVLGIMRQVSLMLPPGARAAASGPELGKRLPRRALDELRQVMPEGQKEGTLVAFVTENCFGCQELLAHLDDFKERLDGQSLILVAKRPSVEFGEALGETGVPTIHDESGKLWEACQVTATPLVIKINSEGRVSAKEVTHRVDRVASGTT